MATHHKYAYDREVRFKLELTRCRNTLLVIGELTAEGVRFLLDSGYGLIDSQQTGLVLDMRSASASSEHFIGAVSWIAGTAESRDKNLTVLASGRMLDQLREAGVRNVRSELLSEVACR